MPVPSSTDRLLRAMYAVPALYLGTSVLAAMLYPGYNHMGQFASELGESLGALPMVFNAGTLMGGFAGLAAALGVHRGLRSVGTGHVLAVLLALVVAANGVAFLFGGWFPLPDHRHTAYNLDLLVLLGSPLAAVAMRRAPRDLRWIIAFLIVNTVAGFALLAVMFGTGNLVTRANIGMWQRGFALAAYPWMAVVGWALLRWRRGNVAARAA
jgi:Protein of unknown function (DUF998)